MQFKNSFILIVWLAMTALLFSACGGDSSTTNDSKEEITSNSDNEPKVVAASAKSVEEAPKEEVTPKEMKKEEKPKIEEPAKEEVKKPKKTKPKKRAKIKFDNKTHDYGFVMQGDTVTHEFQFTNIGNDDLVITRVKASCGCTTPLYPKEPIPPGGDGKISVVFKTAGKLGRQVPNISVYTNYKRKINLELKGFVDAERAKPPQIVEEKVDTSKS